MLGSLHYQHQYDIPNVDSSGIADAAIPVQMIDDGNAVGKNTGVHTMTNKIDESSRGEKSVEEMHDFDVSVRDRTQSFGGVLGHSIGDTNEGTSIVDHTDLERGVRNDHFEVAEVDYATDTSGGRRVGGGDTAANETLDVVGNGKSDTISDECQIQYVSEAAEITSKVRGINKVSVESMEAEGVNQGDHVIANSPRGEEKGCLEMNDVARSAKKTEISGMDPGDLGKIRCDHAFFPLFYELASSNTLASQSSCNELLSINNRTATKIMALVSKKRILANQVSRSDEGRNNLESTENHQQVPRKDPPGPGWTAELVCEPSQRRWHWISPTGKLRFPRRPHACVFEELRNEFGADEVVALEKYREMNMKLPIVCNEESSNIKSTSFSPSAKKRRAGGQILGRVKRQRRVTKEAPSSLQQHRESRKSPPGSGWKSKHVEETEGKFAHHWISPTRNIEFMRRAQAQEFEKLRSKHGSDEILAWKLYRKLKFRKQTRVVTPQLYDLQCSKRAIKNIDSCERGRQQVSENDSGQAESLTFNDGGSK
jgi:hypothetical protein